jgi:hypothetical protein
MNRFREIGVAHKGRVERAAGNWVVGGGRVASGFERKEDFRRRTGPGPEGGIGSGI